MSRTPWPWETDEEAARKERELRDAGIEGSRKRAARDASELAAFREHDTAYRETEDKQYAVKREVAIRKEGTRAFTKARESVSGRLWEDSERRKRLMRDLGMEPLRKGEWLNNG